MEQDKNEILIVDDNPENLRVLGTMLQAEGFRVRVAKNGKQALASIEIAEPDLLLLDIHMPEMSGFELCETLKADPHFKNLPVIFISALGDSFNKIKGFEAGAVDYMTKPFDVKEVNLRVNTHLKLRSSLIELDRLKKQLLEKDDEIKMLKAKLER
jgi:DNA-binding response OmpR family regulator